MQVNIIAKYKLFLIPAFLAFLVSAFYIVVIPGEIRVDAAEYDGLANSIIQGHYSLDGAPSMEREPGYPFFRAVIKTISSDPHTILWVQAILYALIIIIVGLAMEKIEPKIGSLGAWGASLSYGLAFYPSTHLSESLTAFILAIIGLVLVYAIEKPTLKKFVWVSILGGVLMLTRYTYVLVPAVSILILGIASLKHSSKTKVLKNIVISFLIMTAIVGPWVIRNYVTFGQINVAGRSGGILYARAWKADKSWRSLGESYLSVFLGRGILFTIYPGNQSIWLDQWGDWWRDPEKVKLWGDNPAQIDEARKKAAFKIIFGNFNNFSKFVVWSGVDELRLLELQNPITRALGSPFEGTYGPASKQAGLSFIKLAGLGLVHLIQLLWFIGIALSTYFGFKKYSYKFIPGIFLICILIPHFIADNIPRYGAPLQPWLISAIFMTILFPLYHRFKEKTWKKLL